VSTARSYTLGMLLALLSSICLFRNFIYMAQAEGYLRSVEASLSVTNGYPIWKLFQSRVLGPYTIKILSFASSDAYMAAHITFHIVAVAIAGFLCWRLGRKYGGNDQSALLALTVFISCFALIIAPPWLYSWDLIDIIVFLFFIDLVLSRASLVWFLSLFAVAIWNRDSANFIALWLIVDPIIRYLNARWQKLTPIIPFDWRRVIAGLVCIATGIILAESLKRNLMIEQIGPKIFPNEPISADNRYNIVFGFNMQLLKQSLTEFDHHFWFIVPALYVLVATLGLRFTLRDPQRYVSLYVVLLALLMSLVTFALFFEMRVYLILIPFIVIFSVILLRPISAETKST
jgi:hypothetical protein